MLNRSASLAMSTSVLKALPGKLDIKRHSPSLYICKRYLHKVYACEMLILWAQQFQSYDHPYYYYNLFNSFNRMSKVNVNAIICLVFI